MSINAFVVECLYIRIHIADHNLHHVTWDMLDALAHNKLKSVKA